MLILLISGVVAILLLIDSRLMLNVDRIAVTTTTIIDGIRNMNGIYKFEKRSLPRFIVTLLCLVYINYGLAYIFLGGDGLTSFFTTTMHGVVFIFLGLTDLWFCFFVTKSGRNIQSVKPKF